jgi:hypothetical protein
MDTHYQGTAKTTPYTDAKKATVAPDGSTSTYDAKKTTPTAPGTSQACYDSQRRYDTQEEVTYVKEPVFETHKVHKDVHEVQPVIHKEYEQVHIKPHVVHQYEHIKEPTITHKVDERKAGSAPSTWTTPTSSERHHTSFKDKIKRAFKGHDY